MFVCLCSGIRQSEVTGLVAGRVVDPQLIIEVLRLGEPGNCGRCVNRIETIIEEAGGRVPRVLAASA